VHGKDVWTYRGTHPEENAAFDAAMTSVTSVVATSVISTFDFGRFGTVVDVGGGRGGFLAAILNRWPEMRGVLFDQPHVVAGAGSLLADAGVADRCRVESGSFFDGVPGGGDAYVLKSIVHDWPDDRAVEILRSCHRGMHDGAVLLLVERVLQGPNEGVEDAFIDVNMLVGPGGQERTEAEYAALLDAAGLRLRGVVRSPSGTCVLEAALA
jgi:hypothetical protein